MPRALLRSVVSTLAIRLASAVLSFLVFAQVARALPATQAARVLFFSFAFGFAVASLRTFHLIGAGITGRESKTHRLRRIRSSAATLSRLTILLGPATVGLLIAQGIGWPVALAGAALTILCSHDIDLARAIFGRQPLLPYLTAAGGAMGSILLLSASSPTASVCGFAFLLQWVPVALLRIRAGQRLLLKRIRPPLRLTLGPTSPAPVFGILLLAVFDGAVLNAPFIMAIPLVATAAVDLALGNRLFVASLALFPLIASWVISGDIERHSRRLAMPPSSLFSIVQFSAASIIGLLYAGAYLYVSGNRVTLVALMVFIATLLAYVLHAGAVRYAAPRLPASLRITLYGVTLSGFYAAMAWQKASGSADFGIIVVSVFTALAAPAGLMFGLAARVSA